MLKTLLFILFVVPHAYAMHVILDPGHGGHDKGTSYKNIYESNLTLDVAKLVAAELARDNRFTVTLTRTNDSYLSIEKRAELANLSGDIFISIHVNSSTDSHVKGQEIYFQNQLPPDQESLFLASKENNESAKSVGVRSVSLLLKSKENLNPEVRSIVEDLERNYRFKLSSLLAEKLFYNWGGNLRKKHKSIRQAPFYVVSNVDHPAALIEIGYLSNKQESELLINPEYQKKIARGIYKALVSYKESIDNAPHKSLD